MAKYCSNCGSPMSDSSMFCSNCGKAAIFKKTGTPQNLTQSFLEKRNKEKASVNPVKKGKPVLSIFLVIVMIIELCVAAFKYPGFLVSKPEPDNDQKIIEDNNESKENNESVNTEMKEESDPLEGLDPEKVYEFYGDVEIDAVGDPDDVDKVYPISAIKVKYTEDDKKDAPVLKAGVSPVEPVGVCGDVKVNFKHWNLENDEDVLVVKELAEKEDTKTGYSIKAYDFSLESGQTQFATNIEITIPRTDEDEGGFCVSYNEEKSKWELEYSEVSDDGKYYIIRTDHFSGHGKAKFTNKQKAEIAKQFKQKNIQGALSENGVFYYPADAGNIQTRKDAEIEMDSDSLWATVRAKNTLAFDELVKRINETPKEDTSYFASTDAFIGKTDGFNSSFSLLGSEEMLKAGSKYAAQIASSQLAKGDLAGFIGAASAGKLSGFALSVGKVIGPLAAIWSIYSTESKLLKEVQEGSSAWDAAKNHKLDILATAAGSIGLWDAAASVGLLSAAPSAPFVAVVAVLGVGIWISSELYSKYAPKDLKPMEQVYRDFYVEEPVGPFEGSSKPRIFLYDIDRDKIDTVKTNLGVLDRLTNLTDKENEKLKKLLEDGLTALNPRAYGTDSSGKEFYTGAQAQWANLLTFFFKQCEKEPERLIKVLNEFYADYAWSCWQEPDEEFLRYADYDIHRLETDYVKYYPSEEEWKTFATDYISELMKMHEGMLMDIVQKYEDEAQRDLEEYFIETVLPYLNSHIYFKVPGIADTPYAVDYHDIKENKSKLQTSPGRPIVNYSKLIYPIQFAHYIDGQYYQINGPLFMPRIEDGFTRLLGKPARVADVLDYYPYQANFTPCYTAGSETVFTCTYYHYLLMGCPNVMVFLDVTGKNKMQKVKFEVPDPVDGEAIVNIFPEGVTPTPTQKPKFTAHTYKIVPDEEEFDNTFGSPAGYQYAIKKAFENASLTLNSDGSFEGSGSWSAPYTYSNEIKDPFQSIKGKTLYRTEKHNYNEQLSASVSFHGQMGTDDEDGKWEFKITASQNGSTKIVERAPSYNGKNVRKANDVTTWSYDYEISGEGMASWFMDKRNPSSKEEKTIMLTATGYGNRTGEFKHDLDVVTTGSGDNKDPDIHSHPVENADKEIIYSAYCMYFP